jgi:ABC-type sugar transport system ATPase subunit
MVLPNCRVLAMSDRLIVMYKGQMRAEFEHEEVDHELVMGSRLAPTT